MAFSPDGARLASAGDDGTVRLWALADGQHLLSLHGHQRFVSKVVFSPDGAWLASAGRDGTVRLWDGRRRTPALQVEQEAHGLVAVFLTQPLRKVEVVRRIRSNPALSEPVRQRALHFLELVWPERIRGRAAALVNALFDEHVLQADVLESLRQDPRTDEEIQAVALTLARQRRDDPLRLNHASWKLVREPDTGPDRYHRALRWAEIACRLKPENGLYLNTLGVAQYRLGRYAEAVDTLRRSHALNMADGRKAFLEGLGGVLMSPWRVSQTQFWKHAEPADVAFLALAHFRLGHYEEARLYGAWLRYLLQQERWAAHDESQAFLREVEAVLPAGAAPTRP